MPKIARASSPLYSSSFCVFTSLLEEPPFTLTLGVNHDHVCVCVCACACSAPQLCPTLCDAIDYSPPGSSLHGISQARILEWVAISFSRRSSRSRDWPLVSYVSALAGGFFTGEPPGDPISHPNLISYQLLSSADFMSWIPVWFILKQISLS